MSDVDNRASKTHAYQVGPETWIEVRYQAYDADAEPVLGEGEQLGFVFGLGRVFPQVEQALEGHTSGYKCSLTLEPHAAFGERDESMLVAVAKDEFPPDVRPGDRYEVEDEYGATLVLRVVDVGDAEVQVDLNHPLAGQSVRFELEILAVRPASLAEMEAAELDLAARRSAAVGLVVPESLLRHGGRRYENAPRNQDEQARPGKGCATEEKKA